MKTSICDFISLPAEIYSNLKSGERDQIELANRLGYDYFASRIRSLGFKEKGHILDLACGIGQWSIALANEGFSVVSGDSSQVRLELCNTINKLHGGHNISCVRLLMDVIPFSDNSFDGIMCLGALNFTNVRKSLNEMFRVLRPGGRIFLHVNGSLWWLKTVLEGIIHWKLISVRNGLSGLGIVDGPYVVRPTTPRILFKIINELGGWVIHFGHDGTTGNIYNPLPYYPGLNTWLGFATMNEYLIEKI